jgi:y4mF family transcriptional regulator
MAKKKTTKTRAKRRSLEELYEEIGPVATFVRKRRKELGYTQAQLAHRCGLSTKFVKELELGKQTVKLKTVNQALAFFGFELAPQELRRVREVT